MTATATQGREGTDVERWRHDVVAALARGCRFAGVFATHDASHCDLTAVVIDGSGARQCRTRLWSDRDGRYAYPALYPDVPAAFWYERALHDLSGVVPVGHPRLDPLLLPLSGSAPRPRPGAGPVTGRLDGEDRRGPVDVTGTGMFTLPFGPVRSGVFESIEFLLETPGEDVPHLNIRPHYKHRGVAKAFEGRSLADGVLVAERVEGISSVAHALAYCHAVERLAVTAPPPRARLIRVLHAELERIVNHLDVTMRLADAAALAVATARFGLHKERMMRLVSQLCGNRFGRAVVMPGGVSGDPLLGPGGVRAALTRLRPAILADIAALERSPSFLDRLRNTGPLSAERAREHGALGPVGRASGFDDDHRYETSRTYDAYGDIDLPVRSWTADGDCQSRARVRWSEIESSFALCLAAVDALEQCMRPELSVPLSVPDGTDVGWAEAAQGEALYVIDVEHGRLQRCFARSASFHNLLLFHDVWAGDIFTDLPFIEASFGLSYAGVAM